MKSGGEFICQANTGRGEMAIMKSKKRFMFQQILSEIFWGARFINRGAARQLFLSLFLCVIISTVKPCSISAKTCEQWVAKAVSVEGRVEVKRSGEAQWQQVQLDETFCAGDQIRVMEESRADLSFVNQPLLRLDQNSTITLAGIEEESSGLSGLFKNAAKLDLIEGAAHFFSRLPRNLEVRTGFVNAGVEGTEFLIEVKDNSTFITVFEGKVLAVNKAGSLGLGSGQSAVAEADKAPVMRVVANPRNAVRWALYYPQVIYGTDSETPVMQAARLLSVGRVDEASDKINEALSADPQNSNAFALQSIIAVVLNNTEEALNLAAKAVEAAPKSATAHIAHSYAQQAGFDLDGARASLEKAVALEPDNALAWARLAELHSSFGELNNALAAAQRAVELDPGLSRTQTVLGFAYLTQIRTVEAREAFNRAIAADQADSLPRLGLGLAKIRDGRLEEGRRDIEIAASLDANSSLIRSYLGKAYFEEKRTDLDGREYAIAKELDPNDPTPWFYDAIRKQTINQPVEALHDLQKAIELNDNRAVYRSRLMLDSDLAARSASLARIYKNLGFQQRALVEGYNSVNIDPTNFSAHRFLADSYSTLPRHEIARVSELLQSQLLQPTNITPIQPQLAESNLLLINSGGASNASFSEFNPLFNRNQVALLASGLVGENSTDGLEGVVSGIYKKASFSVGYSTFQTDGYRDNNDQDDDIANAYLQYELSNKTSVQAEYRYRDRDTGDVQLRFFEDDFKENFDESLETKTARVGFLHAFTPGASLIGNFTYQDLEETEKDNPGPGISFDAKSDQDAYSGELSYLFRAEKFNLVTGAGYFDIDGDDKVIFKIEDMIIPLPPPNPPIVIPGSTEVTEDTRDATHANLYLYSHINVLENLTVTLGASGDFYDPDSSIADDEDQFNHKVGVTWKLLPDTTVRAAAFRVLKRTLITDQTLEPTQVAGFNQFFDDLDATDAWRYGVAIDQKFSENIFGGAEYSKRDLEVPFFNIIDDKMKTYDWDEKFFRGYLFWTPHKWWALTAEYLYEDFSRDEDFSDGVKDLTTHSVPLGVNFFHPSGLGVALKATYIDQDGKYERVTDVINFENGEDDFWVADAAISYRMPKRYGFFTIGVTNLFDEEFEYFDTDSDNPRIIPDRFFYGKLTLAIP